MAMTEENKAIAEEQKVHTSQVHKGRKNARYLQRMKDEGTKLVQMCPATLCSYFAAAADMAGCDILRTPSFVVSPVGAGNSLDKGMAVGEDTIRYYREMAPNIHINYYMETPTYASKESAMAWGSRYITAGADSMLPMGVSNETLKYMSDNYVTTYLHVGSISGWQTVATGYIRLGKTAEDAMKVFKMAYEYQENGACGMTVELTPIEVSQSIADKLRVPVLSIAGGAPCDGSEMVDVDTFGITGSKASHVAQYGNFWEWAVGIYSQWANDVRSGAYPTDKNGWHMDTAELAKYNDMIAKF